MSQTATTKRKVVVPPKSNVKKPTKTSGSKVLKQDLSNSFSTMSVTKIGSSNPTRSTNQSSNTNSNTSNSVKKSTKSISSKDSNTNGNGNNTHDNQGIPRNENGNGDQNNIILDSDLQTQSITFTRNGIQLTISIASEKMIGNGSFGVVFLARIAETGECIAIKKVLQDRRYKNRELEIMQMVKHPNVVEMKHHFFSFSSRKEVFLHLALEYVPDTVYRYTYSYTKQNDFMQMIYVKLFTYQMLRALNYLHSIDICHRDIKPQNLLIDPVTGVLKICDFGSAKQLIPSKANVAYICSRYYRAPELIFGATLYTTSIDTWSAGCVMGEMLLGHPLFPGNSSLNQLIQIINILGTPTKQEIEAMNTNYTDHRLPKVKPNSWDRVFKHRKTPVPDTGIDLLSRLLRYTPTERIKCIDALAHPFFDELRDQSTRLPNGRSLPELFDFNANELKMSEDPDLKDKLIPEWYRSTSRE